MRRPGAALLLAIALLASAPWGAQADREAPLAVDARAPDFVLRDHEGRAFRLTAALERRDVVVLAFYVKAFTRGWELEFSRFRDDHEQYAALNAEIVGISADPPEQNRAWALELGLPFRLLSDPDGRVGRLYGVWDDLWNLERRVTFVIDRARRIRHVETSGLAIHTQGTLDAVARLAREP